jgi:hypothetical protein
VLNAAIAQGLRTATLINPAGGKLIAAAHPSKRRGERPHYHAVKIDDAGLRASVQRLPPSIDRATRLAGPQTPIA